MNLWCVEVVTIGGGENRLGSFPSACPITGVLNVWYLLAENRIFLSWLPTQI